jgi:PAS domain-containing protein/DNA-binding CsgD family transcriptional regulator
MQQDRIEMLAEAIYDASLDPAGWPQAMALVRDSFETGAACLYSLDYARRRMRPVEVGDIAPRFLKSFEASFYTDDNPSARSPALHRPGIVRTDQRLDDYFRGDGVLRRSRYYHEWLRPQDFAHTMGVTPLAGDGIVFNLSLLRSAAVGPFRAEEIRRFERLQRHLRRALRTAQRLETLTVEGGATAAALERLGQGVIFVSGRGRVLHCNAAAEALLRRGSGLALRGGRLTAVDPTARQGLAQLLRRVQDLASDEASDGPRSLVVPRSDGPTPLILNAVALSARASRFVADQASVMLLIADPDARRRLDLDLLPALYGLTPAEARLARALLAGSGLRQAAAAAGMTYETGRWYLKVLLQKTHTGRQAELVARLLADLGVAR